MLDQYKVDEWKMVLLSAPSVIYLALRGLPPGALFLVLYSKSYTTEISPLILSIFCGFFSETILRSRVYVRQRRRGGGSQNPIGEIEEDLKEAGGLPRNSLEEVEEIFRGPFDLIRWFENRFIAIIDRRLAISRMNFAHRLVEGVKEISPEKLCEIIVDNSAFWNNADEKSRLRKELAELDIKNCEGGTNDRNRKRIIYILVETVGREGARALLKGAGNGEDDDSGQEEVPDVNV